MTLIKTGVEQLVDSPVWAVRWSEVGFPLKISDFGDDEEGARSFHRFLTEAYDRQGREWSRPELLKSEILWQRVDHPTVHCYGCGEEVPHDLVYRDGPNPMHWNDEGGGHTTKAARYRPEERK